VCVDILRYSVLKIANEIWGWYTDLVKTASKENGELKDTKLDLDDSYYSVLDMHYSGTELALGSSADAGTIYNVNINFADPLDQNKFSICK